MEGRRILREHRKLEREPPNNVYFKIVLQVWQCCNSLAEQEFIAQLIRQQAKLRLARLRLAGLRLVGLKLVKLKLVKARLFTERIIK